MILNMNLFGFAFIVTFEMLHGGILTFDANYGYDIFEGTNGSTDCVVNCINSDICISKQMHCHRTSTTSTCEINLTAEYSAEFASIYTHQSPIVYINAIGHGSC